VNKTFSTPSIVILGPTTVGKTEVAFGLARRLGAEIVNADKFYLYDTMPAVTGQSDAQNHPDVRSHLYGVLKLDDHRWTDSRYSSEFKVRVRDIRSRNRPLIVEGCSNGLIRAAVNTLDSWAESPQEKPLLVGLRWKVANNLAADCERRATGMMANGMADEYRRALAAGAGQTYAVRKCFARDPLVQHMRGAIGALRCRNRVAEELEHHARRHYTQLNRIPRVTWIDHDRRCPEESIRRILTLQMPPSGAFDFALGQQGTPLNEKRLL
jgi:tRNA A37 N6-isopentenylltransferase MiaA